MAFPFSSEDVTLFLILGQRELKIALTSVLGLQQVWTQLEGASPLCAAPEGTPHALGSIYVLGLPS